MKFEPSHKLISGFNSISFTTMVLLVAAFILVAVLVIQKPTEDKPLAKNNIEKVKKEIVPQQNEVVQPKNEVVPKEDKKESPVNVNSIVKKVPENNPDIEFDLDFGGKAIRKIKSYLVPEYDESEKSSVNSKLNFTIKPDGSVAKIYPVTKTNTRLELNSIFTMRQWRFEPLRKSADQIDQSAVITFLFRRK